MKKLGRIIAFVGVAGAALAGLWYFLDNVNKAESSCDDEEEDGVKEEERSYVSLDPTDDESEDKQTLKKVVADAVKDTQAKAECEADGVGVVKEEAAEKANDFEFKSFDDNKADEE